MRERERERERESERERDRETDRQTDRQTERQEQTANREIERGRWGVGGGISCTAGYDVGTTRVANGGRRFIPIVPVTIKTQGKIKINGNLTRKKTKTIPALSN